MENKEKKENKSIEMPILYSYDYDHYEEDDCCCWGLIFFN
jgi:hypothetical protein